MHRHSRDRFCFAFIGNEIIRGANSLEINWLCRSGIHDAADAIGFGEFHGVVDGAQRNLKLHDDGFCLTEQGRGGIHIFGRKRVVCTLHDNDAILTARIHKDRSDPAGNALGDAHVGRVNSLRFKVFDRGGAE